ncbi:Protein pacG [Lachnellula hyalina]|uniref:Protein pacG n=1 Tax=Lachnellula hyalina TaxID=1316788 RepID=A0A8H8R8D3_9HELO|nr:Protein pacG [Lachnellula hyalina]TVY28669.1 Protein pacG [Lachnellula hyalina]
MAGYDTLTMSSAPNDILRLSVPDSGRMTTMDPFDRDLNFEGDGLFGQPRDEVHTTGLPIPFTPSYDLSDAFSTTFEDPFSYQSGPFESLLDNPNNPSTQDGDGAPRKTSTTSFSASMTAELYGMFFVAEDVFGGDTAGRPMELTCYRRNLFQISGSVTLSRNVTHMVNEQGQQIPLYDLTATISALESIEGKSTEIISVPWKTSTGSSSDDKAGAAPPKWPLDLSTNPELDPLSVSIPIAWKRLQFKHATANNGRRKGLQQHYVIQINLMATLATGENFQLAEIQSGPIIVRGRSPRNFDSRKDVPLSERKLEPKQRAMSDASASTNVPQVKVDPAVSNSTYRFYALNALQTPLDLPDWSNSNSATLPSSTTSPETHRPSKKPALSTNNGHSSRPPVPKTKWKSENTTPVKPSAAAPIDLSLVDDEYGRKEVGRSGGESPLVRKSSHGAKAAASPENTDLLYEYFPLSLDDWMPPVDAIYRPHVVHHTIVPPDLKAQQVKNKTKRYFSADD